MNMLPSLICAAALVTAALGQCGFPPSILHGTPDSTPVSSGAGNEITYTCDEGYEFDFTPDGASTYTIECLNTDTWEPIQDCQKVQCPVLPDDAQLTSNDNTYQAVVTMSCDNTSFARIPGVDVGDTLTVTCQANKKWDLWDGSNDGCVQILCDLPITNNSVADVPVQQRGDINTFTCDTGYYFNGDINLQEIIVTCNTNGDWEDGNGVVDWECIPKECNDLAATYGLENVIITPETRYVDETVLIACKEGHEFNDSSIEKYSTCFRNETWDFIPFDCQPKLCPPVANITRANISTFNNWYPTVVNFTCDEGYFFPDGSLWRISECNKYGKWSVSIPNCGDAQSIETNFQEETYDVEGAESYSIFAYAILGVLGVGVIVLDVLTFGRQIMFLKRNLLSRFECLRPEEEDLESLDGDEVMRASTISLGRGRITPAASTVDLQYPDKSKQSQLNTLEEVEVVNEELQTSEIAGKKNLIPRTRLASAKSSIQTALQKASTVAGFKSKTMTTIRKNEFASTGLPLGTQNYGKIVEMRPPSPTKEDDDESDESEYTDEDSDEDEV